MPFWKFSYPKFLNLRYTFHILHPKKGFTLIEILVAISIIAIIATIGAQLFNEAQKSARITKRAEDLKNIYTSLEVYQGLNSSYPIVASFTCANDALSNFLVPNIMENVPDDPLGVDFCYQYISNGQDYKLSTNLNVKTKGEMSTAQFGKQPSLVDPARDSDPSNGCQIDAAFSGWAYFSSNACSW